MHFLILATEVFTAQNTEQLLEDGAHAFVNHPRGVNFKKGKLQLSSIYNWYDIDFGANQQERLQHLAKFAEPELAAKLASYDGSIKYDYNWNLNDTII